MSDYDFTIEAARFHLLQANTFVFVGFFRDDNPQQRVVRVYIDDKEVQTTITLREGSDVRRRYIQYHKNVGQEITGIVRLSEGWETIKELKIVSCLEDERVTVYSYTGKQLRKLKNTLAGNLEMKRIEEDELILTGWVASASIVNIELYNGKQRLPIEVIRGYRKDVVEYYYELDETSLVGYEIRISSDSLHKVRLTLSSDNKKMTYKISVDDIRSGKAIQDNSNVLKKALEYYSHNGFKRTVRKICRKVHRRNETVTYREFQKKYSVTKEQLEKQRQTRFPYEPKFSIAIPLYKTKERYLKELLDTILNQTYPNWELCLADGSGESDNLEAFLKPYMERDDRIKYCILQENRGIAGNTNAALDMSTGDYIILCDHDDLLSLDALYECAHAINQNREIDVLYSDEDKVDMTSQRFFEPHFKSDYNIDLLCTMNYICHIFVVRRQVYDKVGGFESRFDGAQDHDFVLRCTESAKQVYHIPKVLYHWRCHEASTSSNPESKLYAFENGCKAVKAHYDRINVPATVEQGPFYGMYRTRYQWREEPLLSIIIPNKDHADDLSKCIQSILQKSIYKNYEIIVVENNSTQDETFAYYKQIEQLKNVTVIYYEGEFNYSRINNFGANHAKGDYYLLLNNDTEMIEPDGIKEMMDICMRDDVGIVGARLFFGDNTIQHAGVIIGFGGMAGHAFIGQDREDNGYFSRIISVQDLSAVTAACLLVKKSVFEEVGGLEEEFKVAFNDIDFCLKVRRIGKLVVYNPYATFYHYESKSRGQENSAEKVARFNSEVALFGRRWESVLKDGDPYYNMNLTLDKADFSLKE